MELVGSVPQVWTRLSSCHLYMGFRHANNRFGTLPGYSPNYLERTELHPLELLKECPQPMTRIHISASFADKLRW
jgi:hypothetical protein